MKQTLGEEVKRMAVVAKPVSDLVGEVVEGFTGVLFRDAGVHDRVIEERAQSVQQSLFYAGHWSLFAPEAVLAYLYARIPYGEQCLRTVPGKWGILNQHVAPARVARTPWA